MKKIFIVLMLLAGGTLLSHALVDSYVIDRSKLPQEAQNMLAEYFPKAKIAMIKIDRGLLKKTDYDVKLVNGTKIEFKNSGKWKSIDCKTRAVPEGLILKPIRKYVEKNFPDAKITKIEKTSRGYEVELSDDVEVKFDHLGTFKGIDKD